MTPDTSTERFAGHTPGPWKAYQGPKDITPFVASSVGDKETICECYTYGLGAHVYNAELIAAAPALLAERDALRENVSSLLAVKANLDTELQVMTDERDALRSELERCRHALDCTVRAIEQALPFVKAHHRASTEGAPTIVVCKFAVEEARAALAGKGEA